MAASVSMSPLLASNLAVRTQGRVCQRGISLKPLTCKTVFLRFRGGTRRRRHRAFRVAAMAEEEAMGNFLRNKCKSADCQPLAVPAWKSRSEMRDLYEGLQGRDVYEVQEFLMLSGVLGRQHMNGVFGPNTHDAVTKWQAQHGLPSTGYWGQMSRKESVNVLRSWREAANETENPGQAEANSIAPAQTSESQSSASSLLTSTSPVPFIPAPLTKPGNIMLAIGAVFLGVAAATIYDILSRRSSDGSGGSGGSGSGKRPPGPPG
eukprot:CAMPEP_0118938678 /NCGR_PEP_ID=MMETSP1169-20130426/26758_1 /TAXON_ID=36882 /ORGANISM="Pyramimonas obovata, Strain CCMP722" /LENGTH=262 /DNA_ID=CAMNT_0006882699 /DNA_START=143 /DNA_END=928 /DNA_ORIENTATION=+